MERVFSYHQQEFEEFLPHAPENVIPRDSSFVQFLYAPIVPIPQIRQTGLSLRNESLEIYRDDELRDLIKNSSKINKDLIYHFKLPNLFPSLEPHPIISIHESNYRQDKRNKRRIIPTSTYGEITGILLDSDNKVMIPCHSCSSKLAQIVTIRKVTQYGQDAVVHASINCSGAPTSFTRDLHVYFEIKDLGGHNSGITWRGSSTIFQVYHSRKRLHDEEEEQGSSSSASSSSDKSEVDQNLAAQHKLLRVSVRAPATLLRDYAHPAVAELFSHMSEVLIADSGQYLSETGLHIGFLVAGRSLRSTPLLDTSGPKFRFLLPHFLELAMSVADVNRFCLMPPSPERDQGCEVLLSKLRDMFRTMLSIYPTEWTEMCRLYWLGALPRQAGEFEWCYCDSCMYAHLSFVVKEARNHKNMSKPEIATMLNEANIPTKQRKKWHPSLTGVINKPGYFVWEADGMPPHWRDLMRVTYSILPFERMKAGYIKFAKSFHSDPQLAIGQDPEYILRWGRENHNLDLTTI